ncbi:MAG: flippase-like domain-containing protein [Vicinamibacteria bacterium]|nr:flippase-like domain-containing protein [Vicinamibacteria bacterium]
MLRSRKARLAIGVGLAALLLVLFFRGIDLSRLSTALASARPAWLLGVFITTLLTYMIRAWRWGFLLAPLSRVRFARLFSVTIIGFSAALVFPRAGEILRPYLIGRERGIRISSAFATIILERLFDLLTMLLLFGLYLYVLPLPAAQARGVLLDLLKRGGLLVGFLALAVLIVLVLFHVYAERALRFFDGLFGRLPARIARPLTHALASFGDGLAVLKAPAPQLLVIAGQSLLLWLTIALGFHFANAAFDLRLPFHATFLMMAFLTVGVAIPTPGMVGGFHEFYLLSLTHGFGIEKSTAAAAGIAAHALVSLPVLALGLFFLGREGLSMGRVAEITDSSPEASMERTT